MGHTKDILEAIYERRSIREYTNQSVEDKVIKEIIRAGSWAPSGHNNQPWRFAVIRDPKMKSQIARQTIYGKIIDNSPVIIAVFADKSAMYDEVKDHMAIGACIQNMLLAVHALNLGAVWLGEILKNREKVRNILSLPQDLELMAVVVIGHPMRRDQKSTRMDINELIVKET